MAIEWLSNAAPAYHGSGSAGETKNIPNITVGTQAEKNKVLMSPIETGIEGNRSRSDTISTDASKRSEYDVVSIQEKQNERIRKAVDEMNKNVKNSEAIFGIHDATNRVTIKIVDKDSKKVLKEYPPEETLDMIAKVWELAGIMVDEKR